MAISNNLYPPIVDTYAPAFLADSTNTSKSTCKVYFSISLYNSFSDIKNAQVTVSSQYSNASCLNDDKYPSEIMLATIYEDAERSSDDKYYIEIKKSDMKEETFEINQYYKVQIRFTSTEASDVSLTTPQAIDSWLASNSGYFSEWSTVCLARGISSPSLTIPGFESSSGYTIWTTDTITVAGTLTFLDSEETETLQSYRIYLYNDLGELLSDSETIYTNNYSGVNEINYTFRYGFSDGETYQMVIEYTTANLYSETLEYTFMVVLGAAGSMDATLTAVEDTENGRIGLYIKGNTAERYTGNLTIRRTSSNDNFLLWDDIYTMSIENEFLDIVWYDCTIESGVWYDYCVQERDSYGNRGVVTELEEPVMITFDHMYLTTSTQQLNVKFDPQISSFKYVVSENTTTTIGSKYPYVKRNGYTFYRQFPISGLISCHMDMDGLLLATREDIYQDTLELYDNYNIENRITVINDYTYERDFREVAMDFLYSNDVKLFRSPTEGNILVKLTDISFTPNQTLGRMIYSFSCTATEIDEFTVENCNYYNIQSSGELDEFLSYEEEFVGQLNEVIPAGTDVIAVLQEKYNKLIQEGYICTVEYLDYLKLELTEDPYLIKEGSDGPYIIDDEYPDVDEDPASAYLGYIVYINGEPFVINKEGIYEINNDEVQITSLIFPIDTEISLSYHIVVNQTEDKSVLPKTIEYSQKVGQCWGSFEYQDSIFQKIWNKYYESYSTYIQSLLSISEIRIEAEPGTVVYVAESGESEVERHVVGETCLLSFEDEDTLITGIYFAGIHFEEVTDYEKSRDLLPNYKFIDTGITVSSLDEIHFPIKNGVYTLDSETTIDTLAKIQETGNSIYSRLLTKISDDNYMTTVLSTLSENKYIWYNGNWWLFTDTQDLLCSVEALVNYTCELSKGWYGE